MNENTEVDRRILKRNYVRYSPSEISTIKTANSQKYINKPREDSVNTVSKSHLDVDIDVLDAATNNRYADDDDIRLVNSGPIALFSIIKLATSSRKLLREIISQAHIVSLMYKLVTSATDTDDLSIGFDLSRDRRQRDLTNNKTQKGKYHVRIYLKVIFDFSEHQEKATYGIGYTLTLTRNTDNAVLNKSNDTDNAKIKIKSIERYVPHYTPNLEQETILSNQIVQIKPTELQYIQSFFYERSNHSKLLDFRIRLSTRSYCSCVDHCWFSAMRNTRFTEFKL